MLGNLDPARGVGARRDEPSPERAAVPSSGGNVTPSRTSLSDEAALLSSALSALRARHDPAGALAAVAAYRARFPAGALTVEVTLAAAEAQRAAGRSTEALSELETLTVDLRGGELAVLRAELRAELGHCAEARAELAPVLSSVNGPLRRRALFTDASCAVTLGRAAEAVVQLEALLALDPSNTRARALLDRLH
jgi:hypothetical protein